MATENNNTFPSFIYGTAWKEDATTNLVEMAVSAGFSAIDTANQPRHYQEHLTGEALLKLARNGISRDELFLQSKFTPVNGHDHRIPYDPSLDLTTQVRQSFENTLKNLHTDHLDSYLLHGPYSQPGLGNEDWEVWRTIEEFYKTGKARFIGISNVNIIQLKLLTEKAEVKPMVVQNRCFANRGWDREVREFCKEHQIVYEGFSLLTANPFVMQNPEVQSIAGELGRTPEQVVFRFSMQVGMTPLTGTTSEQHMKEDLQAMDFELKDDDIQLIEAISG
ncbi:MAG: aldo/keto reductase [Candidatus Scalindua sp.]|jgi:diketogulonate reductase-like aldo/keto reductase|nr:aldo/keto reductase [Candidatus Scalindua sp.]MBT5306318.1 aldo/keto reductase [Candidatus Scalindua sp.]MBT6050141.1 aldo/keto reductase [Candidatus Scalindua sp.]MBT6230499.1 aldo/keto reductase [Candidatus Scalindua sp.]MBT6564608.1 aldo/keto reductase [Candidatus Scalindua sp.]